MNKYLRLLVGLEQSSLDPVILKAASQMVNLFGSKEITFIHVIREFPIPPKLEKEFPHLIEKAIEERKEGLEKTIQEHFKPNDSPIKYSVIVEMGQPTKTIMQTIKTHKIDLVILGRKGEKTAGGVLITRIARRAGCSLLVVTKNFNPEFKTIFLPTDFSEYSYKALIKTKALVKKSPTTKKVIVQHVYTVPVGYHYTGKSQEEFAEIMRDHARNDFIKFTSRMDTSEMKLQDEYVLDTDDDIIGDVYKGAKKAKADLIIIGAKGRTATAALFIGSKTERLVQLNTEIPMLVVRQKGKVAGLFEAMQKF